MPETAQNRGSKQTEYEVFVRGEMPPTLEAAISRAHSEALRLGIGEGVPDSRTGSVPTADPPRQEDAVRDQKQKAPVSGDARRKEFD